MDELISKQAVIKAFSEWRDDDDRDLWQVIDEVPAAVQCEDAVSRLAVKEIVYGQIRGEYSGIALKEQRETMFRIADIIIGVLPSVTPKQRTGKWIDVDVMGMPAQACDQCNTFFPLAYTGGGHHFCPNCGAKMEVTT